MSFITKILAALGHSPRDVLVLPAYVHSLIAARKSVAEILESAIAAELQAGKDLETVARHIGTTVDVLETCTSHRLESANLPIAGLLARRLGVVLPKAAIKTINNHDDDRIARKVTRLLRAAPQQFIYACPRGKLRWSM